MALCQELAKTFNVVVLTSSERQAQEWAGVGGEYFAGDRFIEGVRRLKQKSAGGSLVVFAQRYDGVDLPDEACRILVIDGLRRVSRSLIKLIRIWHCCQVESEIERF